ATIHAAPPKVERLFPAGGSVGGTVEVTISGSLGDAPVQAWCSQPGVTVEIPEKPEKTVRVQIAEEASPGLCWLRFHNAEGASSLRPFVVGTLPEVVETEPNNRLDEAKPLESSRLVVNGVLSKDGEVDAFAVPLRQGETVVLSMAAHRPLGSPMDGILQLVSPAGFVLEQNDDEHGLDPQIVFTAEEDGTYFVRTFAFPAEPTSRVRLAGGGDFIYRLTITTGPFVDHVRPLAVTAGEERPVRPFGWNIPEALAELPVTASSEPFLLTLSHSQLANTAEISIVPHATGLEQEPNGRDQPQEIPLPLTLTGCIDAPEDADVYRFTAAKGQKLAFRVESRALGQPLDPVLNLTDAGGKSLRRVDDASRGEFDAELEHAIPADGDYRLEVTDLHGRGGFRYVYRLTAGLETPRFSLELKSDAFTLPADKPLEVPVTVGRDEGFDGEITVSVEGLPEHVTAEAVASQPKGDTSKTVKLTLTAKEPTAWSGPIRIIGTSDEGGPQSAAAPLAGLEATTTKLWLTVRGSE
ncbi:MAG: PPC domain-containing protein, partial [Planctomycetaceae bacterium]